VNFTAAANADFQLQPVDATDASLDVAEDAEVGATYALCALPEKGRRIARSRTVLPF
jgi:L-lactate utilization protein LutC